MWNLGTAIARRFNNYMHERRLRRQRRVTTQPVQETRRETPFVRPEQPTPSKAAEPVKKTKKLRRQNARRDLGIPADTVPAATKYQPELDPKFTIQPLDDEELKKGLEDLKSLKDFSDTKL